MTTKERARKLVEALTGDPQYPLLCSFVCGLMDGPGAPSNEEVIKSAKRLGLTEEDLNQAEQYLADHPDAGDGVFFGDPTKAEQFLAEYPDEAGDAFVGDGSRGAKVLDQIIDSVFNVD